MKNLFLYKWTHKGELVTDVISIIPFLIYISRSRISHPGKRGGGIVFALHITPFFTIGVNCATN